MKTLALLIVTLLTAGCAEDFTNIGAVSRTGLENPDDTSSVIPGVEREEVVEFSFEEFLSQYSTTQKRDVLWVIDNSGSMQAYHTGVVNKMNDFSAKLDQLPNLGDAIRMGILSSDTRTTNMPGTTTPYNRPRAGFAVNGRLDTSMANWVSTFNSAVSGLGVQGSGIEMFMKPATDALTADPAFLRSEAKAEVIFLTDTDDQTPTSGGMTVSQLVDQFGNYLGGLKGGIDNVHLSLVTLGLPEWGCNSSDDLYNGANAWANAWPNTRIKSMLDRLPSKAYKLCGDFGAELLSLAQNLVTQSVKSEVTLPKAPVPGTIVVAYNGKLLSDGVDYVYDAATNSIKFPNLGFFTDPSKPLIIGYNLK